MSGFQSSSRSDGRDAASEHSGLNFPASASSGEHNEDADVYQRLAQKERDLILAAELGKALLDSNQELQAQYDHTVEEYSLKVEVCVTFFILHYPLDLLLLTAKCDMLKVLQVSAYYFILYRGACRPGKSGKLPELLLYPGNGDYL